MADNTSLREQLIGIRDERRMSANTATRIGGALLALLDYAGGNGSYLRKDMEDSTRYLLRLLGGAVIGNGAIELQSDGIIKCGALRVSVDSEFGRFLKGISGGMIDSNGDGELGSLVLRDSLVVPQITYNNIQLIAGNAWRAPGGGTILRVAEIGGVFYGMLKLEDSQIGRIAVGDKCQGVFHQGNGNDWNSADTDEKNGNFHFSGFTSIYFEITKVIERTAEIGKDVREALGVSDAEVNNGVGRRMFFTYRLRSSVDDAWNDGTHPQPQMDFSAYSNYTNADRQQCVYETPDYEIMLVGMTGWTYGHNNIVYIRGNLNGFTIVDRDGNERALTGWGIAYGKAYQWGNIEHLDRAPIITSQRIWAILMSTTATPVPGEGEWTSSNIQSVKPTKDKPYLWHVFEYAYDREDSSVPRWSAPWLASQWSLGESSLRGDLTNEMDSFATDSDGKTTKSITVVTTFRIYYGTSSEVFTNHVSINPSDSRVKVYSNIAKGDIYCRAELTIPAGVYTDTIKVEFTGETAHGSATSTLTIQPVAQGADGKPSVLYSLMPSDSVIKKDKDGNCTPSRLSCRINKQEGDTFTENVSFGTLKMQIDGGAERPYAEIDFDRTQVDSNVTFILYDTNSKVIDRETIPIVADGQDGQDGEDGEDGKDGQDGSDGEDGKDGQNGLDAVQPNLYGYDIPFLSSNANIIKMRVHTPTGFAAYINKSATYAAEYTSVTFDFGSQLVAGRKYALSFGVKTPFAFNAIIIEQRTLSLGYVHSSSFSAPAANVWKDYVIQITVKENVSVLCFDFQQAKTDEFSGLLEVRDLKVEDATDLAGTHTAFDGLAASSEQQPDNLIADARLICDLNRWRTYLDGAHSVSNLAHGMSGYESQNVLIPANGERDVLEQSVAGRMKPNTWYTLSYYARLTQDLNGVHIQTFVYPSTSAVPSLAVADGEAYISQRADGYHVIDATDGVTEWRRHSLTFRTPASLPADYKVLWRIVNPYGSNQTRTIQICAPMLNETEQLFDWQEAHTDRVGAMPRPCGEWRSGSTYVWNGNFRDIVIYESNYYAVKREGSEVTSVPTNGSDWELADRFSFVATDLLLATQAFVENLGVRIVQTAQDNEPRIVMQGSQFQVFGNLPTPSIQMAVRADGVAVLEFYDANGNKMYDLGPESITQQVSSEQSRFYASDSVAAFDVAQMATKANLMMILNLATTQYYRFGEGWKTVGSVKQYYLNGAYNNKVYDSNKVIGTGEQARPAGTPIASGSYFGDAMQMLNRSGTTVIYGRKYFYVTTSGLAPQDTGKYLIYKKGANGTMTPCDLDGLSKPVGSNVRIAVLLEQL